MTTPSLLDARSVQEWLGARSERLGLNGRTFEVVDVERLSRGVSRETWSVELLVQESGEESTRRVMVRRDHPAGGLIPIDLRVEYDVYHRLYGTGVPVAKALWFEDDPHWMPDGRPAYVRDLVEGDWRLPVLAETHPDHDQARIALSKEHVSKLALVHQVDWRAAGFGDFLPAPATPADCAANLIDHWMGRIAEYGTEPSPILAEAVASLRAREPKNTGQIVLCKGTNGLGEEVWADGKIVALSDWELAAIGDPAYDFAQCQQMIPEIVRDGRRIWGLDEALDHYASLTGLQVPATSVHFYQELAALMQLGYTQHARFLTEDLAAAPLRFVWSATEAAYRSELKLARRYSGNLMSEELA
jgi:aminoglycoside phosphotransferase (APT) family kinase protein